MLTTVVRRFCMTNQSSLVQMRRRSFGKHLGIAFSDLQCCSVLALRVTSQTIILKVLRVVLVCFAVCFGLGMLLFVVSCISVFFRCSPVPALPSSSLTLIPGVKRREGECVLIVGEKEEGS